MNRTDSVLQPRQVPFEHLRVERDDRAVEVVVGARGLLGLQRHARVEDRTNPLVEQVLDVAVRELGRVADVLAGDRLHALLEDLVARAARRDDAEPELREDREPERVVLVHVEHARDADVAARGLRVGQPAVSEEPLVLVVEQVRQLRLGRYLLGARATLAAVAGDVPRAVAEVGDRQPAVVLAQPAGVELRVQAEVVQLFERQRLRLLADLPVALGGEGRAVRTHEAGDVGSRDLGAGLQLERTQHGVVEERAALDDDLVAELGGVLELDDLVEGVADDGVRQARGDVADARALALCLLDRAVHEHRAAGTEVDRRVGLHRGAGERVYVGAHGCGERLQERAAARRARLVDRDRVDHAVADPQVLHVLAADVDDARHAGADLLRGPVVGHRLDLAVVETQRGPYEPLAVAGDAGASEVRARGDLGQHAAQDAERDMYGVVAALVVVEDDLAGRGQQDGLDRRRAGVDAEEQRAGGGGEVAAGDLDRVVPLDEVGSLLLVGEQRTHPGSVERDEDAVLEPADEIVGPLLNAAKGVVAVRGRRLAGEQRGADRDEQVSLVGSPEGGDLGGQRPLVRGTQLRQEVQRAAEEDHVAADRVAAGEAGDRLGRDGLEDGGGEVGVRGALVEQRLQVGLREDAAARGDRVEVLVGGGQGV